MYLATGLVFEGVRNEVQQYLLKASLVKFNLFVLRLFGPDIEDREIFVGDLWLHHQHYLADDVMGLANL